MLKKTYNSEDIRKVLEKKNILFIYDDKKDETYIRKMIEGFI